MIVMLSLISFVNGQVTSTILNFTQIEDSQSNGAVASHNKSSPGGQNDLLLPNGNSTTQPTQLYFTILLDELPNNCEVLDSQFNMFNQQSETTITYDVHHVNLFDGGGSWTEDNLTYFNQPCGNPTAFPFAIDGESGVCNTTTESQTLVDFDSLSVPFKFDITTSTKTEVNRNNNNVSFMITGTGGSALDNKFRSSEHSTVNNRPFLNVTCDTTPPGQIVGNPTFGSSSKNISNIVVNDVIGFSQVMNDNITLSSYRFADNQSGAFVNSSSRSISGLTTNTTFNLSITLGQGNVIGFQWHLQDTEGFVNITEIESFTIINTPPQTPTILAPTVDFKTNLLTVDFNVTFPADADSDPITISYYINGVINFTSANNVSFESSDGDFILNVSISDGFSSSANATVNFTVDRTDPVLAVTSPLNQSTHSSDISVEITCTDINGFILNYTFFNESGVLRSIQDTSLLANTLSISDVIEIENLTDGNYNMNISCSDVHTRKTIPDFQPFKDLGNLKLTYTTPENDVIGIKLKSTTATLDDFGTFKQIDRYIFWFNMVEPETEIIYEYVFKIDNKETLIYLPDSDFNGHFVTKYNWIDFEFDGNEDAVYIVKETQDNKFEVKIETRRTGLHFESIGGLNIVNQELELTIDTSVSAITGLAVLPLENVSSVVGMIALLLIIIGVIFGVGKARSKK